MDDDTQGKMGDTSGRGGTTSGKIGDTSGRTLEDVKREIVNGRSDERIKFLENKVARLEQDILSIVEHFDAVTRALAERLDDKVGETQLATNERNILAAARRQLTEALAPLEARVKKLETPTN
jgi:recombinational DNA repair ATPase RecF